MTDEEPVRGPPPPLPPLRTLDYGPPESRRRQLPVVVQGLLGFVGWFGAAAAFAGCVRAVGSPNPASVVTAALFTTLGLGLVLGLVQLRLGWRGLVPGMLLGLLLTCLVPVGIVAVACGGSKF